MKAFYVKQFLFINLSMLVLGADVFACEYDIDCEIGASCAIDPMVNINYGVCVGGSGDPDGDKNPFSFDGSDTLSDYDNSGTFGKACEADSDCGTRSCRSGYCI